MSEYVPPAIYVFWKRLHELVAFAIITMMLFYIYSVWSTMEGARRAFTVIILVIFLVPVTVIIVVAVLKTTETVDKGGNKVFTFLSDILLVITGLILFQELSSEVTQNEFEGLVALLLLALFPLFSAFVLFFNKSTSDYLEHKSALGKPSHYQS